ncbi:MAG: argininosuccinate lyase [Candidatus Margulisiibacteriota bacterium]
MANLWGGRFKKPLDARAVAFSYSFTIDSRLYPYDLALNLAHAKSLHQAGFLTDDEIGHLETAIDALKTRFDNQDPTLFKNDEDIHSCIERNLTETLGDLGKKIHTGKSRNDQVITDSRLFVKHASLTVMANLKTAIHTLWQLASNYKDAIMPGFTHFQTAQPVVLAHHLLAYVEMLNRDLTRFKAAHDSADVCTLGAGALAGNNYGLDRQFVARELGFSSLSHNSMDAVADRDFMLDFMGAASVCMTHLTRLCEELILWSSPIMGFIDIGDEFTTGSSIMPQKKNPDIAELIRGKSGRVLGNLTALTHIIKSLPLTYNRDLQEDKPLLFDAFDTVSDSLECLSAMLKTVQFDTQKLRQAASAGYSLATDFADYLVKKGTPFRDAHEITGHVVQYAVEQNKTLEDLSFEELKTLAPTIENDVMGIFNLEAAIASKNGYGATAFTQVQFQLNRLKEQFGW